MRIAAFVLAIFTTIAVFADSASKPAIQMEQLVGNWKAKIGDFEQVWSFDANGDYSQRSNTGTSTGTWALDGNTIVLTGKQSGTKMRCPITGLTADKLTLRVLGLTPVTFTREK